MYCILSWAWFNMSSFLFYLVSYAAVGHIQSFFIVTCFGINLLGCLRKFMLSNSRWVKGYPTNIKDYSKVN